MQDWNSNYSRSKRTTKSKPAWDSDTEPVERQPGHFNKLLLSQHWKPKSKKRIQDIGQWQSLCLVCAKARCNPCTKESVSEKTQRSQRSDHWCSIFTLEFWWKSGWKPICGGQDESFEFRLMKCWISAEGILNTPANTVPLVAGEFDQVS